MSYRDDLKAFRAEQIKRKKTMILIVKITVIALAVAFLVTAVLLVADLVTGDRTPLSDYDASSAKDTKAPVIALKSGDAIYMYVGENVALKGAVSVTDNSGSYTLTVDNKNLNKDKVGVYEVTYTATDASGNSSKLTVRVVVTSAEYSHGTLMTLIEKKAASLGITKSMSKKEQVSAVYSYVNDTNNIAYDKAGSNIPDIDRDNWETDWVEEAIRTLSKGSGDCYSYYSVSKAFFEYLGIENVGIQRDNSNIPSREGTHFWFVVNIGTNADEWYYYDATRLAGKFTLDNTNNACLITLKKIRSYKPNSALDYDFYTFDPSKYPTVSTKELS